MLETQPDPHAELERQITEAGSVRELARRWKMSAGTLSEARKFPGHKPRHGLGKKLLRKLGFEKTFIQTNR